MSNRSRSYNWPAFPVSTGDREIGHQSGPDTWQFPGIDIRDYFAAKAMQSFLQGAVLPPGFDASEQLSLVAMRAYEIADAMLRERAK